MDGGSGPRPRPRRHGARSLAPADSARRAPPALGALRLSTRRPRATSEPSGGATGGSGRGRCESGRCAPRAGPPRRAGTRHRGRRRHRDLRARASRVAGNGARARHHRHQRQVDRDRARGRDGARRGLRTVVAGNIGVPVLDALDSPEARRRRGLRASSSPATSSRPRLSLALDAADGAQRHAGPPRPLRLDGGLRGGEGAHLHALPHARG